MCVCNVRIFEFTHKSINSGFNSVAVIAICWPFTYIKNVCVCVYVFGIMHTLLFIRKTCIIPDGVCVCVLLCSLSCLAYFVLKRHENLKHSIVIQPTDAIQVLFIYFILRTTYRCSRRSFFLRFNFIVLFVHFAFGSPFCCRLLYYIFHSPFIT